MSTNGSDQVAIASNASEASPKGDKVSPPNTLKLSCSLVCIY